MPTEPRVHRAIFYPHATAIEPTFVVDVGTARLGCHVQAPYPDAGLLLYFHGNGELAAECDRWLAEYFLELGVNVCFVEYRGYGASTGEPAMLAMMGDGERVVQALGVPPERIVAFGRSLGSLFAVELARRLPTIAGLIVESGIAAFFERFHLTEGQEADFPLLDQEAKMRACQCPLLVMHTLHDGLVESSHGQRLHDWAASTDKRLLMFERGDHNSIRSVNQHTYAVEVEAFCTRVGIRSAIR